MVTGLLHRLQGVFSAGLPQSDEHLRRVALRLAARTVVLLLVMLVVLEIVVYVITRQALLGSLETTLANRAQQSDPSLCAAYHLPCANPGSPGPGGGSGPPPGFGGGGHAPQGNSGTTGPSLGPSEASAVYVDRNLHVVHGDGLISKVLLDAPDVRKAFSTLKDQCCSTENYLGQDYLVYTSPIHLNTHVIGAVQTSISEHQYEQTMSSLLQALLVVAVLGLVTSGGISAVLVRRSLAPIQRAVQRQRDFVADAAHELRTPLAIMRTVGEVGMSASSAGELQATVAQMLGENQHLTRLVDDLSLLARSDTNAVTIERDLVDLSSLVQDTSVELTYLAEEQGVALTTDIQGGVHMIGDVVRLRQLLLILLDNALKHTPSGGKIGVSLGNHAGRIQLQVTDSGPGIPADAMSRIFDRFYRSDQSRTGEGSGLGLAIGKWITEAHGGQIGVANAPTHGAVFTAVFPSSRQSSSRRLDASGTQSSE